MTRTFIHPLARTLIAAGLALSITSQANAASLAVELACAADYYSYCSQHPTEGAAVRGCMRANGDKLSQRCLKALISAGEVSRSEVESKTARAGR
jgi:hypothetical protein